MTQATDMLAKYLAAETSILAGQTVQWGDQRLGYADLNVVQTGRREWQRKVTAETRHAAGDRSRAAYALASFRADQ